MEEMPENDYAQPTDTTNPFASIAESPLTYDPKPVPPSATHQIFFGRFGMRAGWGIAIFIVCWLLFSILGQIFAVGATGHMHEVMAQRAYVQAHPNMPKPKLHIDFTPTLVIVADGLAFLATLGLCWFFSRGERRPLRAYGIGTYRVSDVIGGGIWGVILMSALVFVLKSIHVLVFDSQNVHGVAIFTYGAGWLLAFLLVGFAEEYGFRGYIQYTLMRGVWGLAEKISANNPRPVAFWIAATTLSLLFACAHLGNGGENIYGLLQVFLAGIVLAYGLWKTGSLWWSIGFHCTWDWSQSFLYGVADSGNISVGRLFITHPQGKAILSGGADGPEGSILSTVALLIAMVVIYFLKPGVQPAIEQAPKPEPTKFHSAVA